MLEKNASAGDGESARSSRLKLLAPASILALYLVLGFHKLGFKSLGLDEAFSLRDAAGMTEFAMARPLFFLLLKLWMPLGHSEFVLRTLPVLIGLLGVAALYLLARKYVNEEVALWSSLLLAMSTSHLNACQQIRFYPLITLSTLIEMYVFLSLHREFRFYKLLLYWLSAAICILTSPTLILLNFVQVLFLFFNYREKRKALLYFFSSNVLMALAGIPWWLFVKKQLTFFETGWIKDIQTPSIFCFKGILKVLGTIVFEDVQARLGPLTDALGATVILIALTMLYFVIREKKFQETVFLLAIWILFPILTLLVAAGFGIKLFHEKALYYLLPAYCLAFGYFLSRINRAGKAVILSGALALGGIGLGYYYFADRYHTCNWRVIAQETKAKTVHSQGPIVFYPEHNSLPFRYYAPETEVLNFPYFKVEKPKKTAEIFRRIFQDGRNYWVLTETDGKGEIIYQMIHEKTKVLEETEVCKDMVLMEISTGNSQ